MLAGFRIVSEIGRGAFARVYLAEQVELASRRVALKVSSPQGEEPQVLARLQHAHIVPIHSVFDDPESGLRLLCMPYLGGANLAQVLEATGASLPSRATGRSLVTALDLVGGPNLEHWPSAGGSLAPSRRAAATGTTPPPWTPSQDRSRLGRYLARLPWWSGMARRIEWERVEAVDEPMQPARRYYRNATYIQATVWIAARLAEALEHAHNRGLLHRDLKPSNILIAADGTPMLLDFNLSAEIRRSGAGPGPGADAEVGGTLPYMAPEHLDAFDPYGTTPPEAVDERSDLYALGLILFEMVTGQHPFVVPSQHRPLDEILPEMIAERWRGSPSARAVNPAVPWSLESILHKCLAPNPERRYQQAADLAEDLRRFLEDMPLAIAPELSLSELCGKWARRHPRACSATSVGSIAMVLLVACLLVAGLAARNFEAARTRLRWVEFQERFREAKLLLNTTSGPREHDRRGIEEGRRALAIFEANPSADWLRQPDVRRLDAAEQLALRQGISELLILLLRVEQRWARLRGDEFGRREVLTSGVDWLEWAETIDPQPPRALYELRADFLAALGREAEARRDRRQAAQVGVRSPRDRLILGTDLLAQGRADDAEPLLYAAATEDPENYWAWFTLGLCQADRGRHLEAAGSFGVCTALARDFSWGYLNRGLELARIGRLHEARKSYDQALRANPDFLEALVDRGLVCLELDDAPNAERDLARALRLGQPDPAVLASYAEALDRLGRAEDADRTFADALRVRPGDPRVLLARGAYRVEHDPVGARADFEQVLAVEPEHPRAHFGLAQLLRAEDPAAALAHLERALAADRDLLDAVELRALIRSQQRDRLALDDVDRLAAIPTARRLYNAACAVARLTRDDPGLAPRAIELLRRAVAAGHRVSDLATDSDLDVLRDLPAFLALLPAARPNP